MTEPSNQATLTWLGSGILVVAGGLWTVFKYVDSKESASASKHKELEFERSAQELTNILDLRAKIINREIKGYITQSNKGIIENHLSTFNSLHEKHIEALKKGKLVLAHEILININSVSADFERTLYWDAQPQLTNPDGSITVISADWGLEAFANGILINGYLDGDFHSHRKYGEMIGRRHDGAEAEKDNITNVKKLYEDMLKNSFRMPHYISSEELLKRFYGKSKS